MEVLRQRLSRPEAGAAPVDIGGQLVSHTASIGVAMPVRVAEQTGLLGWADVAMYAAKARGRNQAVCLRRGDA
jgi:GGDEF domain-containing protein